MMNCWRHDGLALLPLLQVLCTTSTLAMGVNLPAHLVIIKGTRRYCGGASGDGSGYEEYDRSMCLQMAGRAGRPQFDNEGVAVIMTQRQVGHCGGHPAPACARRGTAQAVTCLYMAGRAGRTHDGNDGVVDSMHLAAGMLSEGGLTQQRWHQDQDERRSNRGRAYTA